MNTILATLAFSGCANDNQVADTAALAHEKATMPSVEDWFADGNHDLVFTAGKDSDIETAVLLSDGLLRVQVSALPGATGLALGTSTLDLSAARLTTRDPFDGSAVDIAVADAAGLVLAERDGSNFGTFCGNRVIQGFAHLNGTRVLVAIDLIYDVDHTSSMARRDWDWPVMVHLYPDSCPAAFNINPFTANDEDCPSAACEWKVGFSIDCVFFDYSTERSGESSCGYGTLGVCECPFNGDPPACPDTSGTK